MNSLEREVLVMNKNWWPVAVANAADALTKMYQGKACAVSTDDYAVFRFGKWVERGVEKVLFGLEGSIKVLLDRDEYVLNPQDTLYFDASIPHQLVNSSGKQAKLFCAVSPSRI